MNRWRMLSTLRRGFAPWAWQIVALALVASVAALLEVAAIGLLVVLARLIADGKVSWSGSVKVFGDVTLTSGWLAVAGVGCVVARFLLQALSAAGDARVATSFMSAKRNALFVAFVRSSWEQKSVTKASEFQTLLTTNVDRTMHLLQSLTSGIVNISNIIVMLTSALVLSPVLALGAGVSGVVLFLALRPLSLFARRLDREDADINLIYADRVTEAVHLAKEIEVFDVREAVEARVAAVVEHTRVKHRIALFAGRLLAPVYNNIVLLIGFSVLTLVATQGGTRVEVLGTVVVILLRITSYTAGLQSVYHHVVGKTVYLEQLLAFQAASEGAHKVSGSLDPGRLNTIALSQVTFRYRVDAPSVLHDVTFTVRAGEMIGVAGPSGSGKSTLTKLFLGLYAPTAGAVLVNGMRLADASRAAWAKRVAFVPQEPLLIAGSVADNVRFFRSGISDDDIHAACKAASMHDVVMGFAQGYATVIGERGAELSVGQRQRVCIARALVTKPDLIVLDEPTSALDAISEQAIQRTLETVRRHATLIIIAHRLSTIENCDRVLILNDGRVEGFDAPAQLAAHNAFYKEGRAILGISAQAGGSVTALAQLGSV